MFTILDAKITEPTFMVGVEFLRFSFLTTNPTSLVQLMSNASWSRTSPYVLTETTFASSSLLVMVVRKVITSLSKMRSIFRSYRLMLGTFSI